ncbi:MAG: hypothetical protein U9N82_11075 [Thermodesulfobacteriota bacterium]|nr:hypothetical protein [Thermodesulfobacteriota bacterium]
MHKYLSIVRKDFLLLIRDRAGLAILFIMPAALVFIMTLLQDSSFRAVEESRIPIIFVDYDNDTIGHAIRAGLTESRFFEIHELPEIDPSKKKAQEKLLQQADFK